MSERMMAYELQYVPENGRIEIGQASRVEPGTDEANLIYAMVTAWMAKNGLPKQEIDNCTPEMVLHWIESGAVKMVMLAGDDMVVEIPES